MSFKEYQKNQIPSEVNNDLGLFLSCLGEKKDEIIQLNKDIIKNRFTRLASTDALNLIGENFNISKPEILTEEQYRTKLLNGWNIKKASGTVNGLIAEIKELGFTNVAIVPVWTIIAPNKYQNTLNIPDHNPLFNNSWATFWILIGKPHNYQVIAWGDKNYKEFEWGGILGDLVRLKRLVTIVKENKPAWTSCRGVIFANEAKLWDTINWGAENFGMTFGVYRVFENWENPNVL